MLKSKKSVFACILSLLLVFMSSSSVFAAQNPLNNKPDIVKAKHDLYNKHSHNYKVMTTEEMNKRSQEIDTKMAQLQNAGASQEEIDNFLEKYNIYRLENTDDSGQVIMSSQPGDVNLDVPMIYFDSEVNQWILSTQGYWYNQNIPIGEANSWGYNVGGYDTIGISLHDTYGNYQGVSLVGFSSWCGDQAGNVKYNKNAMSNNYSKGASFMYQDYIVYSNDGYHYMGAAFGCTLRYSSNFTNYNGNATTIYGHTWSSCGISSVSFGVQGNVPGANITFTKVDESFPANSPDAPF